MSINTKNLHGFFSGNWDKRLGFGLVIWLALGGLAVGCDSTSTEGPPGATGGSAATAPATGGAPGGQGGATGPTSFSAELLESVREVPVSGWELTVRALDNQTGKALPGFETVCDANARVTFENLPAGHVGFLVVAVLGQSIDTYQFNIESNIQDETLWVVVLNSVQMAINLTGIQPLPGKADVAGAIYWLDANGDEWAIGCAEVQIDNQEGEIRYFAENELPTTNVFREDFPNQEVRTASNPKNGKYYIGNTSPGVRTVTAFLNGQQIGSASLMVFPREQSTDGENAIAITNIYVQGQSNPTPPTCQ